ncbi:flagellar motor switch protein FliM [Nocardioides mangrovicus]|uniref:flagellar motor switch protein FliM n=1 Tax=Nocardioides mangrovicus TaxID=2478913 RepID=UPI001E55EDCC|nr:FliM/FliN family flagellar motor switch protein [Nocardioides mangrovicus]
MSLTAPSSRPAAERVVTPYDFRRPIQLSREHARILQVAFDSFAHQAMTVFTSMLRRVCQVSLGSIEQHTYAEYVESLGSTSYLTVFSAEPMAGLCVIEMPLGTAMVCVDHMLGGPGGTQQPLRPLTEIESVGVTGLVDRLLTQMRGSLDGVIPMEPEVRTVEYSPQFAQAAGANDVVVVVTLDLVVEEVRSRLSVCLPFHGLLPHLVAAAAPAPVSDRERAIRGQSEALLRAQFEEVPVEVAVRFRPTHVTPTTLSDLAPGDVIRLSHPATAPLAISADDTPFAHATAGTKGLRLAALIVGTPEEER